MSRFLMQNGGIWTNYLSIQDEEKTTLSLESGNYDYHQRTPMALSWEWSPLSSWPRPKMLSGDPSVPLGMLGMDCRELNRFGQWQLGLGGKIRPFFIRGFVKDAAANPLGGAVVSSFDSATNAIEGTIAADDRGYFEVPCLSTNAHYCHAFYQSGSLAGRTVNTLIPTL